MNIRRVVTGHDEHGRAVVVTDEICGNVISRRPQHASCVIWSTGSVPADNADDVDGSERKVASTDPHGTVFRVVEYQPGVAPRNHRTESIDYAVVISGEIDMQLDGAEIHLRQGDVLVQRGTMHNWVNRGEEICRVAFVIISSEPIHAGEKALHAEG